MSEHVPTTFVRRLVADLAGDRRVVACWLEADDESVQWPPFESVDVHVAVDEPDLDAFRGEFADVLGRADAVSDVSQQDAPFKGFAGTATLSDGTPLTYRLERTSQLAKVARRHVNLLVDRTGGLLIPALTFEE